MNIVQQLGLEFCRLARRQLVNVPCVNSYCNTRLAKTKTCTRSAYSLKQRVGVAAHVTTHEMEFALKRAGFRRSKSGLWNATEVM